MTNKFASVSAPLPPRERNHCSLRREAPSAYTPAPALSDHHTPPPLHARPRHNDGSNRFRSADRFPSDHDGTVR